MMEMNLFQHLLVHFQNDDVVLNAALWFILNRNAWEHHLWGKNNKTYITAQIT